jgi:hypothetical protein
VQRRRGAAVVAAAAAADAGDDGFAPNSLVGSSLHSRGGGVRLIPLRKDHTGCCINLVF